MTPPWTYALVAALLLAALCARLLMLPLTTIDQRLFLVPWLEHAGRVGRHYLERPFTNYAPAYEHVLALLALFPGSAMLRIKLFSILFDVILAGSTAWISPVAWRWPAFCLILLLPTVALNSALMGQCDAIYATFVILALGCMMRDRPAVGLLAFATGLAIKLQSMLFAPFLALMSSERRLPVWTWLLLPVPYLAFALPMILAGRPVDDVLFVYARQTDRFSELAKNAPNPWALVNYLVTYPVGMAVGVPLALFALAALMLLLRRKRVMRSREGMLLAAAILLIAGPYLMPKMHDRFFYLVDPVLVALVGFNRRYWPALALAEAGSLLAYLPFVAIENRGIPHPSQALMLTHALLPVMGAIAMGMALILLIQRAATFTPEEGSGDQRSAPATSFWSLLWTAAEPATYSPRSKARSAPR